MSFKKFIKTNKEIRKVFGRKEIGIMLKQLDGLPLTQSERNRLSRDIRPKLRFIKEASKFDKEFELKKNSNNLMIIDRAVELIINDALFEKIQAVFLFGSHSKGTITIRSDIDICVVFDDISLYDASKFRIRVVKELSDKVDIQVFNVLPQKIKRDIARNHKLLYKKESFDNMLFTIRYLKDEDFFIRKRRLIGEAA